MKGCVFGQPRAQGVYLASPYFKRESTGHEFDPRMIFLRLDFDRMDP